MDKFYRKVHWIKKGTFSRRVFSVLMALAMVISLLPLNAMEVKAADYDSGTVNWSGIQAEDKIKAGTIIHNDTGKTVNIYVDTYATAVSLGYKVDDAYKNTGAYTDYKSTFYAALSILPGGDYEVLGTYTANNGENGYTIEADWWEFGNGLSDIFPPDRPEHTITATAVENGSISPSDEVQVTEGEAQTFTITPNAGYEIDTLTVDGTPVEDAGTSYTFNNVTEGHTIDVTFKQIQATNDIITNVDFTVDYSKFNAITSDTTYGELLDMITKNFTGSYSPELESVEQPSTSLFINGDYIGHEDSEVDLNDTVEFGNSVKIDYCIYSISEGIKIFNFPNSYPTITLNGSVVNDYSKHDFNELGSSAWNAAYGSEKKVALLFISANENGNGNEGLDIFINLGTISDIQAAVNAANPSPTEHTITATAGENGSISPSGEVQVTEGESKTFTITPNAGYEIDTLKVDGTVVEASTSYTFSNVTAAHTIAVTFKAKSVTPTPDPEEHTHTLVTDAAVAATCTETGLTAGSHCSVCGEVIVAQKEVPALGHDWSGEWKIVKEATATEIGKMETTCTRDGCGTKKYKEIPATGTPADPYEGKLDKDAEVAPDAPIEEATLDNTKKELLEAPAIFTTVEKAAIESGAEARVWIEISKTDESSIPSEDKTTISETAKSIMGEDSSITYFDANLFKKVGDGFTTPLHEPGIDVEVTIKVPTSLVNTDNKFEREYKIIRLHTDVTTGENSVDILDGTFDKTTGELTFKTDKFSTYAIAYTDKKLVTGVTLTSGTGTTTLTQAGQSVQLTATVTPTDATDKSVTWTSSNTNVATVDATGKVTAVANGTCVITATTIDGGKTATVTITVNIPSTGKDDGATGSTANATPTDTENKTTSPKTGDDTPIGWLFALVLVSASGMIVVGKKRKYI